MRDCIKSEKYFDEFIAEDTARILKQINQGCWKSIWKRTGIMRSVIVMRLIKAARIYIMAIGVLKQELLQKY